jgi:hypothetical protein
LTVNRLKRMLDEKNLKLQDANEILEERVKRRTAQPAALNAMDERFVARSS